MEVEIVAPVPDSSKETGRPATSVTLMMATLVIVNVSFLFWWAVTLGPVAIAGFFGWLTYLSLFTYLVWRNQT